MKSEEVPHSLAEVLKVSAKEFGKPELSEDELKALAGVIRRREQLLLHVIEYDIAVPLTSSFSQTLYKQLLGETKNVDIPKSVATLLREAAKTPLCLLYQPKLVAAGAMYLAWRQTKLKWPEVCCMALDGMRHMVS